ncbi:MAG: hypothetical protein PHH06_02510 [Candidatus Gracilibacteria bacterium]|nr:hypothetical protein [Candidatus Gracilibacteria bacterium]
MNTPILFITQLFGVLLTIIGISLLFNGKFLKKMVKDFSDSESIVFISGFVALVFGFYVVSNTNSFENSILVILTILGWIITIKGIVLLIFPRQMQKIALSMKGALRLSPLYGVIYIILGLLLTYNGFFV